MAAKVSVIIPSYNCAKFLSDAIDSALAQRHVETEVIVVDDGSTDNSREVLNHYGDKIVCIHQPNRGVAHARNRALEAATAEYVAFLDADDVWTTDKLSKQLNCFDSGDVGLVYGAVKIIDAQGTFCSTAKLEPVYNVHELMGYNRIALSTAVCRKTIVEAVGGFSQFTAPCEDWDLWIRIAAKFRLVAMDDVVAYYRIHSTNASSATENAYRGRLAVISRAKRLHRQCPECTMVLARSRRNAHFWYRNTKLMQFNQDVQSGLPRWQALWRARPRSPRFMLAWIGIKLRHSLNISGA